MNFHGFSPSASCQHKWLTIAQCLRETEKKIIKKYFAVALEQLESLHLLRWTREPNWRLWFEMVLPWHWRRNQKSKCFSLSRPTLFRDVVVVNRIQFVRRLQANNNNNQKKRQNFQTNCNLKQNTQRFTKIRQESKWETEKEREREKWTKQTRRGKKPNQTRHQNVQCPYAETYQIETRTRNEMRGDEMTEQHERK